MIIAIAGPYTAPTKKQMKNNLDKLNSVAAQIYEKGHIPFIGVNAALFVSEKLDESKRKKAIMDISLALVKKCDALLFISESPGAIEERDMMISEGKKIFYETDDIPENDN